MISQTTIQNIKETLSTYDIVSQFVKLKRKGVDYVGLCPFHNEKTPSFTVSPSKNIYKCFGCGCSGDGITFVMKFDNKTYIEALKFIAEKNNIQIEEVGSRKIVEKPLPRIEKLSQSTIEYFEKIRGISNNTLLRFGITEAKEWMPKAQKETNAICFNYFRNEELVNIKFRAKGKDFKMAKNAELIFYNLDSIKDQDVCYITEGEIDCLSLYEVGIFNAVSVPNGAAANQTAKLEYLDNCFDYFLDKKKVVLVVDNDASGKKLEEELARRIGYEKCYIVKYTGNCKDANEVLIKYGKNELRHIIDTATQYPLYGEIKMDDMYESIVDFYENGYPQGYECGISREFDEHLKFYPGQLTIVTGIPGSGKSEFVDWIMTGLVKTHAWNFGICSFECPPEFHVTKLAEKIVSKSFAYRTEPMNRINPEEFEYSLSLIDKHFHFMNLSLIDVTIDGLISKAEEFVKRYGINGFLFDPWNCIEAKEEGTNYILQCLNKLINFLEKYKVHGFLVAHPTKLKKDLQTKKYEIPNLYSISGSAHFFNRTHNGLSVYRDFETNRTDVYIQKVKWSWLGKVGFCSYDFNTYTRAYRPI
jgi:twinkle protein